MKAGKMAGLLVACASIAGMAGAQQAGTAPVEDGTSEEERLVRLERAINNADSPLVDFGSGPSPLRLQSLDWGLLLEVEGAYAKTGNTSESDLILATVEFAADAQVNDWLSGRIALLYEEDVTEENNLDEAVINVGRVFYAEVGKFYLPFGNFETAFVSDPLTLELAEINKSSVAVGYAGACFGLCAGAFKGDDEATVADLYAAAGVSVGAALQFGTYWVSELMETDGLVDLNDDLDQKEGGAGAYVNLRLGPVACNAEYVSALGSYDIAGVAYTPMAYNFEASVGFAEKWMAGAKVEGSEDFYTEFDGSVLSGKFHGRGYGAVVSYGFHENATVSVEYLRLQELANGVDGDLATVQLAFEI